MRDYLESQRRTAGLEPTKHEFHAGGGIGCYPTRYVDPHTREIQLHTARTVADTTRLADAIPNIEGIGSCGVPSDVPPLLQPLWMRFISWRYAKNKISNSYILWDHRLCPLIAEFAECVAAMEPEQGGVKRFFRGENYIISPLRYAREEALQFEWLYQHGYRITVGNLPSLGGATPVTLAGSISLALAESIIINFWHHVFYGDKGLYLVCSVPPLDMRTGCMPYGRPEQALTAMAMTHIADSLGSLDGGGVGGGTAAKGPNIECGLNKGLAAGIQYALHGSVDWHFGIFSVDEIYDPRLIVIENEFVEGLKRLGRGFEVNERTLAYDAIREVCPGGEFTSHPHTLEHFREELWLPDLFNGMYLEGWMSAGRSGHFGAGADQGAGHFGDTPPRGISEQTEDKLLALIEQAAGKLGIAGYRRPDNLPE